MTDFDAVLKDLVNAAVDRELAGRRAVPPFDRGLLARPDPGRPEHAGRAASWAAPVLAAVVVTLLVAVSVLVVDSHRGRRIGQPAAGGHPSSSRSADPGDQAAARAYAQAVAATPEAGEVAGVWESLAPEEEARAFVNSSYLSWEPTAAPPAQPVPGRSYQVTMDYLVGPRAGTGEATAGEPTVVSSALHGVAAGSCPQPFLARPGRVYSIHCEVTFRAGVLGTVTFTELHPAATLTFRLTITDPAATR